jgi:hypothetical protein
MGQFYAYTRLSYNNGLKLEMTTMFLIILKIMLFIAIVIFFLMIEELIEQNLKGKIGWIALIINIILLICSIFVASRWLSPFIDSLF